jgi:hypothetical protein
MVEKLAISSQIISCDNLPRCRRRFWRSLTGCRAHPRKLGRGGTGGRDLRFAMTTDKEEHVLTGYPRHSFIFLHELA